MYYSKYSGGETTITEEYPFGKGAYAVHRFETPEQLTELVFGLVVSEKQAVSEILASELDEEIQRLVKRAKEREAWIETQRNMINALKSLLRRIMAQIAIQAAIDSTHRNRDYECRQIVRDIVNELGKPDETYYTQEYAEIDNIPF